MGVVRGGKLCAVALSGSGWLLWEFLEGYYGWKDAGESELIVLMTHTESLENIEIE